MLAFLCTMLVYVPNASAAPGGPFPPEPIFPPDPPHPSKRYALIVGVSDYYPIGYDDGDLSLADEDANDWYAYLKYTENFDAIRVLGDATSSYTSYYGLATEANIKSSLNWLRYIALEEDSVAVILIGHGDKTGYMESYYKTVEGNHLDDNELTYYLDDISSERIFVFLDCCRSGGFINDLQAMPNHQYVFTSTACGWDGVTAEAPELNNGLWTYFYIREYQDLNCICSPLEPRQEDVYAGAYQDLLDYYYIGNPQNRPHLYDGNTNLKFLLGDPE